MQTSMLQTLLSTATASQGRAYAPYSKFKVGVAIESDAGITSGCNVETVNYKGTCAEAGAIAAMIAAGGKKIKNLVVVGPGTLECTPCGDCRQRILEFADAQTQIYTFTDKGAQIGTYTIADLLPKPFGPENLKSIGAA